MTEEEKQEEKQERKTLSIEELLTVAKEIEKNLATEHHLTNAEIMFVGTIIQASTTTDYVIHTLIKKAHVQVIEMRPDQRTEFKPGEN
jgi:uncharacterized DUF497 family protein